jgi:DNA-directed RNA polymerase subunit RPC12/RpoP
MTNPSPNVSAEEKVRRYVCPGCSAHLTFEPKEGSLVCPYCGRKEQIPSSVEDVKEQSYLEYLNQDLSQARTLADDALEVHCSSCGSVVTFTPPEVAGQCPFCGSSIVAQPKSADPVVAPGGVLPFRVAKSQAVNAIQGWLASRWLAPNALKALARQESIWGVYLPFWTYDAFTISHYTGERGEHYWETETYEDTDSEGRRHTRTRQVQKTRWYPASGTVSRWFDDMLVPATISVSDNRLDSLQPWDLHELRPYDPSFLAGFKAQRYQIPLAGGFEHAKETMQHTIREDVRHDIGGDEQRIHNLATSYSAITFKHLLLPVWIGAYRFIQKTYQVLVNARTGEVQGDRPYSVWKVAGLVSFIVFVILMLIYLGHK